jgi:hypothetical protein
LAGGTVTGTLTVNQLTNCVNGFAANGNIFPGGMGTNGQLLATNGAGALSWVTPERAYLPLAGGTVTGFAAFQQGVTFQSTVSAVGGAAVFVIDNTANPPNEQRATISVQPDGKLTLATTNDAGTTIQGRLRLDRNGHVQVEAASLGTFVPGQPTADLIAEDVAIGLNGVLCQGPVNLNASAAILSVTNAAGRIDLNCVSGAGVTQGQYRIQAQTTGAFRIRDVLVGADRVSWAADGTMTHPGSTAFQGVVNAFRQASINSEALGPMQFVPVSNGARQLVATDIGKVILLSGSSPVDINLSVNGAIPVGSVVEILNTATGAAGITCDSSTFLFYNVRNTYFGGTNADVEFAGRYTTVRLIKTAANTWVAIGDLANPNK